MKYIFSILLLVSSFVLDAQSWNRYKIEDGDTTAIIDLPACYVGKSAQKPVFKNKRQERKYNRLTRYVIKVYPYATTAASKLKEYEFELDTLTNVWRKREIMREVEKALISRYGDEMKNLTMMQGQILLKLIDRQTGNTTFEVVKELRGGVSATMWQGIALIFGGNLKSTYEPKGKDWMIEDIVLKIERGII